MARHSVCVTLAGLAFSSVSIFAQVQAGAVISSDGLSSFYFAIGNYYHVPEREVTVVRERAIPPDETPVVFYVAQCARVQPAVIVDLRRRGMSWVDVAAHFRLSPDIYYFESGPPYGKAHGYWKNHPPRDVEVVEAVNVHFLSDYHRVAPDVIVTERSRRGSYAVVAADFADKHHKKDDRGKGQGKGHGKDHD
jgi:hypothetical protein